MVKSYPYLSGIHYESVADGPGVRTVIYLSGCRHNCKGCHNPQTHDPLYGQPITIDLIEQIADEIALRPYINGITLSGGDPLYEIEPTLRFVKMLTHELVKRNCRKCTNSIWIYTGYTWESLMEIYKKNSALQELMLLANVIVEGPFLQAFADKTLAFRGSSNQRIVDVKKSIANNTLTCWNND